jgi:hypothetical protein
MRLADPLGLFARRDIHVNEGSAHLLTYDYLSSYPFVENSNMVMINPFGLTFLSALVAACAFSAFADDGCSSGIEIYIPLKPEDRWSGLIVQDWLGEDDFNNTWSDAPTDDEYKRFNYARFFKSKPSKDFVFHNGPEDNPRITKVSDVFSRFETGLISATLTDLH